MPVTIKDVAKAAGVSPSTVTRVIQNKSTISDETKKRVRKAMKELNYHPNLNARSLVSSYTQERCKRATQSYFPDGLW